MPVTDAGDHRLYAAHLGRAVLKAGILVGGNFGPGGAVVRGLSFDVADRAKTSRGAIVNIWGASGRNVSVLDTTINGHDQVDARIIARQVEGLVIERVSARNFRSYGILADENTLNATVGRPPALEDITVSHVVAEVPRSSDGTAEACIWLGDGATLRRARVRICVWDGIWTGTSFNHGIVSDVDIDQTKARPLSPSATAASTVRAGPASATTKGRGMCSVATASPH